MANEETIKHNDANQRAVSKLTAKVIEVPIHKRAGRSEVLPTDPSHELTPDSEPVEPPFDMLALAMLQEYSTEMTQCVEAMEINIDGFGHRFVPRIKKSANKDVPEKMAAEINREKVKLTNFFQYCTSESFIDFRRKLRRDLECTGNCYFEVVRGELGEIQSFNHVPSYQMKICKEDEKAIKVDRKVLELQEDGSVRIATIKEYKKFRKLVQSKSIHLRNLDTISSNDCMWFKAFGDPRRYDAKTGEKYTGKKGQILANEMVHMKLYSPRTPYGLPRYIGNLLSIYGDRAAEEINYVTFRNNNIPSMAILVSNGQITEGSIERIQSFVESQVQGSDNYSKMLLLEAEGYIDGEESGSHAKIEIKPLTETQHKDALFQNYSEKNQDKVRRAWRLPPIYVGRSSDYTRATAESSRVLADEQVFAPERESFDQFMNRIMFPEMGIVYHKYRSNSPNTTDNQQMVKIISQSEKTGGMTPKIARQILEDMLSIELPEFPPDFPEDVPFSLTMAEAVKNQADATEPGQQVTALKAIKNITKHANKKLP